MNNNLISQQANTVELAWPTVQMGIINRIKPIWKIDN